MSTIKRGGNRDPVIRVLRSVVNHAPGNIDNPGLGIDLYRCPLAERESLTDRYRGTPAGTTIRGSAEIDSASLAGASSQYLCISDIHVPCGNGLADGRSIRLGHSKAARVTAARYVDREPRFIKELSGEVASVCDGRGVDVTNRKTILRDVTVFLVVQIHKAGHEYKPETRPAVERDAGVVEHPIGTGGDDWVGCRGEPV